MALGLRPLFPPGGYGGTEAARETAKRGKAKTQKTVRRRRGVILPVMLAILLLLGLLAAGFAYRVHAERSAMNAVIYQRQARLAAESGIQKALLLLRTQRGNVAAWYDNPDEFNRIIMWSPGDDTLWATNEELEEGTLAYRFSLVADNPYDDEDKCRYGITDESAKLNLNTATAEQLGRLISQIATEDMIVEELVDALLDWRDENDTPLEFGAESQYYASLDTPYRPKSGDFDTVEELLMVKGFDGRVLYGEDQDRNGLLTPNEDDGEDSFPDDDGDGKLNRGLYPYVTVLSRDRGTDRDNRPRVYLYGDPTEVREQLSEFLEEPGKIDFILQSLAPQDERGGEGDEGDGEEGRGEDGEDQPGGTGDERAEGGGDQEGGGEEDADVGDQPRRGGDEGGQIDGGEEDGSAVDPTDRAPGGGGRPRRGGGPRKDIRRSQPIERGAEEEVGSNGPAAEDGEGEGGGEGEGEAGDEAGGETGDMPPSDESGGDGGGASRLASPCDLLTAGDGGANPLTLDDLPVLMERTTTQDPLTVQEGLINVLTAPAEVLRCLDGLPEEAIGAIIGMRPELTQEEQFSTAWLVTREILTLEQYQQIAPRITASGLQFTIEALGYGDHVGTVARLQVIVEMRGPMAQVLYYRDLTSLGAVYPIREGEAEFGFGGQRG